MTLFPLPFTPEPVVITPQSGVDANGDPLPAGSPFTVSGLVAPGNTAVRAGAAGDLDSVDFTVYLPLMIGTVRTAALLDGSFTVTVRGRVCVGRVKVWDGGAMGGGVEVLATARAGMTP